MQTFMEFISDPATHDTTIAADLRSWATQCVKKLDDSEVKLLNSYCDMGYEGINAFLRRNTWERTQYLSHAKTPDAFRRMMRGATSVIDGAFQKCRAPRALTLYRGVNNFMSGRPYIGRQLTFAGYSSASLKPWVAVEHSEEARVPTILEFLVPRGYPAIPIFGMARDEDEYEVLLPNRAQGRIVKVTDPNPQGHDPYHQFTQISIQLH
jgi:hypothetical protein